MRLTARGRACLIGAAMLTAFLIGFAFPWAIMPWNQ